jgi:hypothetical protein
MAGPEKGGGNGWTLSTVGDPSHWSQAQAPVFQPRGRGPHWSCRWFQRWTPGYSVMRDDGWTWTHQLCSLGDVASVQDLLAPGGNVHGDDLNATLTDGTTPIFMVCQNGHTAALHRG